MEHITPDRVRLTVAEAQQLSEAVLQRTGFDTQDAHIIANHVMDAALCGYEYSGLPKILNVLEHKQLREPRRPLRVIRETPMSALYDGGNHSGMVTMYHMAQVAITKARATGFGIAGVNNSWVSGRSAHYVEMVARAGFVGIHSVNSRPHVAAPGSKTGVTGTNPVAFGFPTQNDPFLIDMGSAAFMGTDLIFQERRGATLPEGVAMDKNGNPTRVPSEVATIMPFGGYKGFALALAMQALGALAGAGLGDDKTYGYLIMAISPELMLPLEDFKQHVSDMLAKVKAAPRQLGVDEIRLPGERAQRDRARLMQEGLTIDRKIYDALLAARDGPQQQLAQLQTER